MCRVLYNTVMCRVVYKVNKVYKVVYKTVLCRVVYNSNERSVDFCPIADIDSNSTVLVSISTSSPTTVPVSEALLPQTWNLSKILHTQIFRLKVLHRKSA